MCSEECALTPPKTMGSYILASLGFPLLTSSHPIIQKGSSRPSLEHIIPCPGKKAAFLQTSTARLLTGLPASFPFPLHTFSDCRAPTGSLTVLLLPCWSPPPSPPSKATSALCAEAWEPHSQAPGSISPERQVRLASSWLCGSLGFMQPGPPHTSRALVCPSLSLLAHT